MSDTDWLAFIVDEPPITDEERAIRIADILAAGSPSQTFCKMLADMIRPNGRNCCQWRFDISRKDKGRPAGPNWQVALEMERLKDREGKTVDFAVAEIQKKFGKKGHSKRTCESALEESRKWTRLDRLFDEWIAKPDKDAE